MSAIPASAIAAPVCRAPLDWLGRCRLLLLCLTVTLAMSVAALVMVLAQLVTFGGARRFCTEVIGRGLCRYVLWVFGVKLVVHGGEFLPTAGQVVYISNHTSSLDCFILPALGLPNARFFLSGFLRRHPLICILGYCTGTIWTCSQRLPAKRARLFQRAEDLLRRTGESVYLSPEGQRVTTGEVGHFNKGAFHLATNLQAPLVPFYIATPRSTDPGMGLDVRPGVVHVWFQMPIATADWRLADLEANRRQVRSLFLRLHEDLQPM